MAEIRTKHINNHDEVIKNGANMLTRLRLEELACFPEEFDDIKNVMFIRALYEYAGLSIELLLGDFEDVFNLVECFETIRTMDKDRYDKIVSIFSSIYK